MLLAACERGRRSGLSDPNDSPPLSFANEPLPPVLAEIAGVIGRKAALKIAETCGGTRVYIPAKAQDDHWLIEAVGRSLADKLCRHLSVRGGGILLDIPLGPLGKHHQAQRQRDTKIGRMTDDGKSSRAIAIQLGISQRTVHEARRRLRDGHYES